MEIASAILYSQMGHSIHGQEGESLNIPAERDLLTDVLPNGAHHLDLMWAHPDDLGRAGGEAVRGGSRAGGQSADSLSVRFAR